MMDVNLQVGFNDVLIEINNISISCKLNFQPDSDTVIFFLHGLGCDKESFINLFDYPDFEEFNYLMPDLVGFGHSSKPEDFSYNLDEQALIIGDLLNCFNFSKIHIVAHSMGGAIALLLPEQILSKTSSFANIEGNLISEDCNLFSRKIVSETLEDYRDILYNHQKELYNDSRLLKFDLTPPYVMYKSAKSLVKWSDSDLLLHNFKGLKTRKAYFFGEENLGAEVLNKLNGIERIMIAHSGHEMMAENPDEFYSRLYDFILDQL